VIWRFGDLVMDFEIDHQITNSPNEQIQG